MVADKSTKKAAAPTKAAAPKKAAGVKKSKKGDIKVIKVVKKPQKLGKDGKPIEFKKKFKPILSGKFTPADKIRVSKQIMLSNLAPKTTEKDIYVLLRRFKKYLKSVRIIRSKASGKKCAKGPDGKKVASSRGYAFVRLRTAGARRRLTGMKMLTMGDRKIRVGKALVKKAHLARKADLKARKKESFLKKKPALVALKQKMRENQIKNKKRARNMRKKLSKKKKSASKDGAAAAPAKPVKDSAAATPKVVKRKLVKKAPKQREERRRLSGTKAQKARPRMSRK